MIQPADRILALNPGHVPQPSADPFQAIGPALLQVFYNLTLRVCLQPNEH